MNKVLSTGTQKLYQSVVARLGNGYVTTKGMQGPIAQAVSSQARRCGLATTSQHDQFLRHFAISNPNIAFVQERWYGRDIATRATLGNQSLRHRCIVDMTRNNDGGLLRAIFDKFGHLKKTLSIAKDGSSVSTLYKTVHTETGIANLSKKVVRDHNGTILREVYSAKPESGKQFTYTFVKDAENGLKQINNSHRPCHVTIIYKQGDTLEVINEGIRQKEFAAGVDANLKTSKQNISDLGWVKFLQNKIRSFA